MSHRIILTGNSAWNIFHFRSPLIDAFETAGDEIHVVAPQDKTVNSKRNGVEFHDLAMDRGGMSPVADLVLLRRYERLFSRIKPDVVLAFTAKPNIYGSIAAHRQGIPVINNVSGLGTAFLSHGWLERLVSALYRYALARSSTVFFQNEDDLGLFVGRGLVRSNQTHLLPGSGIDLVHFAPRPPATNAIPTFVCIARMLRDKGVRELAEASRQLREQGIAVRVKLVGPLDPDNRSALSEDDIAQWVGSGLVDYVGALDDVRGEIAGADCVVLPSYREGLPRTLLEAAAMARPVITTDVPGCRAAVDPGVTGLLCAVRSGASLADAMGTFLNLSVTERAAMGRRSRERAEQLYDQQLVVDAYRSAIFSAVACKSI